MLTIQTISDGINRKLRVDNCFFLVYIVTVPVTSRRVPVISEDFKKPPKFSYPNSREISHRRKLPSPLASSYFPVRSEQMIRQCPPPFSLGHSLWGSLACPLLPLFSILVAFVTLTRITSTILNSLHSKTLFPWTPDWVDGKRYQATLDRRADDLATLNITRSQKG